MGTTGTDSDAITYSISGGDDKAKFNINSSTGVLNFTAAPDYENPADGNIDNVYEVTVKATENGTEALFDEQEISVTVMDVDEDVTPPTVSISSEEPNPTNNSAIPVSISFSETVKDFAAEDLTIGNGTVTSLTAPGLVYAATLGTTAISGSDNDHFHYTQGVAVGADGKIYVADGNNHRIQIFNADRSYAATLGITGTSGSANDYFNLPSSVAVDADGKVYVADQNNHRIQIFNADGTYAATLGTTGTLGSDNDHFRFPSGVAVDAAGKIYVADYGNHRIQIFNADRTYLATLGTTGESGNDNNHFNIPIDVAVDADGMIYVVDGSNLRIQIFNADYSYAATLGTTGESGNDNNHFNFPRSVALDAAGKIYVADRNNHRVQIFNTDGTYAATLGTTAESGNDNDHFNLPFGVAVDAAGKIYVADYFNHRIQIFEKGEAYQALINPDADGLITVDLPADKAMDAAGNENTAAEQFSITYDGTTPTVTIASSEGSTTGKASFPVTFTFTEKVDGFDKADVVVGNGGITDWQTIDNITFTAEITAAAYGAVTIDVAAGVATDEAGNSNTAATQFSIEYVDNIKPTAEITSTEPDPTKKSTIPVSLSFSEAVEGFTAEDLVIGNGSVASLTAPGLAYAATIGAGTFGKGNDQFKSPSRVAIAPSGKIYVADLGNHRIQIFNADGTYAATLGTTGEPESDNDHFNSPYGVAVDANGKIYVADRNNNRIQVFNADGTYATTLGTTTEPGSDNDHFNNPYGVAVDAAGKVYVADQSNHRIQIFNADGTYAATLGTTDEPGNDNDHFQSPFGVAVDAAGKVYVADQSNHRIQIFNADGTYAATLGTTSESGSDNNHFNSPYGVAVDAAGKVYVADLGNQRIQIFNADHSYAATLGTTAKPGKGNDHFNNPFGVAVDAAGKIYVADLSNQRIQVFENGGAYQAMIEPTADGLVTVDLPAGVVTDEAGNENIAAEQFSINYDGTAPSLAISSSEANPTSKTSFSVAFTFTEKVDDFDKADVVVNNGGITDWQTSDNITFTAEITAAAYGPVTIDVAAGVAKDAAGNKSTAASQFSIRYDATAPEIVITSEEHSLTNKSTFAVSFAFNEEVEDFTAEDVTVGNGSADNFQSSDNKTFTADITAEEAGLVTVDVAAEVATDAAGNGNTAATQFSITYDLPPVITTAQSFSIFENSATGTALGKVTATDILAGTQFQNWTIVSSVDANGNTNSSFTINSETGEISVADGATLDGSVQSFTLSVTVSDGLHTSVPENVVITVVDPNKAPTDILLSTTEVEENKPAGTLVGTLSTVDPDTDDAHTYQLVEGEGSMDNDYFYIKGNQLFTNAAFDAEIRSSYNIRISSNDGNEGIEKTITIKVKNLEDARVFIPNLFSPNGDGNNDTFRVRANGIAQISFRVFNRMGEMVFETSNVNQATEIGWDGRYKGKAMPSDTYVWQIIGKFSDGSPVLFEGKNTGNVTLIR